MDWPGGAERRPDGHRRAVLIMQAISGRYFEAYFEFLPSGKNEMPIYDWLFHCGSRRKKCMAGRRDSGDAS